MKQKPSKKPKGAKMRKLLAQLDEDYRQGKIFTGVFGHTPKKAIGYMRPKPKRKG